jgi:putative colanic acid biosynthesis glycosyltransferase WcaI
MRIHLHDFSGHPFQAQLSRSLASREHEIVHSFSGQYVGGKGNLGTAGGGQHGPVFVPVVAPVEFRKYSLTGRALFESKFAPELVEVITRSKPDVVILCNLPLVALAIAMRRLESMSIPIVIWHQDVASIAMAQELRNRLPWVLAASAAAALSRLERNCIRRAQGVVAISPAFMDLYSRWGVQGENVRVIPNWAPLDEIFPARRDNEWAARHGLPGCSVRLLYSGTLGRKHNPLLLLELLRSLHARGVDAHLTVVSEGEGAEVLQGSVSDEEKELVTFLPFQRAEDLSEVLSSADFLISLLEPLASSFSVPSKVLSYLAVGRPVVGLMPGDNPASEDLRTAGGFVGPPSQTGATAAGEWIAQVVATPGLAGRLCAASRALAEDRFDVHRVTTAFEEVIWQAAGRTAAHQRSFRLPGQRHGAAGAPAPRNQLSAPLPDAGHRRDAGVVGR